MKKRISVLFAMLLWLGCSAQREENQRSTISPMDVQVNTFDFQKVDGALDDFSNLSKSSCQVLDELVSTAGSSDKFFRYFSALTNGGNPDGKVSVLDSPFVQTAIAKKMVVPSPKEAFEIAKEEFMNGEQSLGDEITWAGAQCLYHVGYGPLPGFDSFLCNVAGFFGLNKASAQAQFQERIFEKVNATVEANFPGIFGGNQTIENSLFDKILVNASKFRAQPSRNIASLSNVQRTRLMAKVPLGGTVSDSAKMDLSLQSAKATLKGFYSATSLDERVCALTLAHRGFAQMINMKGFEKPVFQNENLGDLSVFLQKVSNTRPKISLTEKSGRFLGENMSPVHLSEEAIETYDPKVQRFYLSEVDGAASGQIASLKTYLLEMHQLLHQFVLTSPAEKWVSSKQTYLLDDVSAAGSLGVLPAEAHGLALGLLTVNLKNLPVDYLKEINAAGLERVGEEARNGIVIGNPGDLERKIANIEVDDLLSLTHFVIRFSVALESLSEMSPTDLDKFNSFYDESTVNQLLNRDNPESALNRLLNLHAGLAILILQMANEESTCYQNMQWDLTTGEKTLGGVCSDASLKENFKQTLALLANRTKSPILKKRSEEL